MLKFSIRTSAVGSEDLTDIPKESSDLVCLVFMSSILAGSKVQTK
jgi:hypothetical protein